MRVGTGGKVVHALVILGIVVGLVGAPALSAKVRLKKNSVKSSHIKDGHVLSADIGADQVLSDHIANGQVTSLDIGTGEVDTIDLALDAVTGAEIANGAVRSADLIAFTDVTDSITVAAGETKQVSATCPAGDRPIFVGADWGLGAATIGGLRIAQLTRTSNGGIATGGVASGADRTFTIRVTCMG